MTPQTDRTTVLLVVGFIGAVTLLLVAGALWLVNGGHAVPDPIWSLAGTAIGALAAVLVSTRSTPTPPGAEKNAPPGPPPLEPPIDLMER